MPPDMTTLSKIVSHDSKILIACRDVFLQCLCDNPLERAGSLRTEFGNRCRIFVEDLIQHGQMAVSVKRRPEREELVKDTAHREHVTARIRAFRLRRTPISKRQSGMFR